MVLTLKLCHEISNLAQAEGGNEVDHGQVAGDADEGVVAVENDVDAEVCKKEEESAQHGVGPVENVTDATLSEQVLQVRPPKKCFHREGAGKRCR